MLHFFIIKILYLYYIYVEIQVIEHVKAILLFLFLPNFVCLNWGENENSDLYG